MEKNELSESEFKELQSLADYIVTEHIDLLADDIKILPYNKRNNKAYKLGILLGYQGQTIYHVIKTRIISNRGIILFFSFFDKMKGSSEYKERAKKLKEIIQTKRNVYGIKSPNFGILEIFRNTQWFIYETDGDSIIKNLIYFKEFLSENIIDIEIETFEQRFSWIGTAHCDSSKEYLIINTYNSSELNSFPKNYMIKIDSGAANITLCIGHVTFPDRVHYNVKTKTIILQKAEGNSLRPLFKKRHSIYLHERNDIFRILYSEEKNTLSTPANNLITEPSHLSRWLNETTDSHDKINNDITGLYNIFYKNDFADPYLVQEVFKIDDREGNELSVIYHQDIVEGRLRTDEKSQQWIGTGLYNRESRALYISFEYILSGRNDSAVYMIWNVPFISRKIHILTGVMLCARDNYEGIKVEMLLAYKLQKDWEATTKARDQARKEEIYDPNENYDEYFEISDENWELIENFFKTSSKPLSMTTSEIPVMSFSDLKKVVEENQKNKTSKEN